MRTRPSCRKKASAQRRGFAVVIAITLMAFLVLLLLALTILVRSETIAADNARKLALARENARYGMLVAMGQLQKLAGPDQRATAPAALLEPSASTNTRHWTAILYNNSGTPSLAEANYWLVSSNLPTAPLTPTNFNPSLNLNATGYLTATGGLESFDAGNPTQSANNRIILLGPGSVGNRDDVIVVQPTRIIGGDPANPVPTGQFAYWVGDESFKARINLEDAHSASGDTTRRLYAFQTPGRMNTQWMAGFTTLNATTTPLLSKLTTSRQVANMGGAFTSAAKERFHDYTLQSYGVLSNARTGGLRKDLSLAFEVDAIHNSRIRPLDSLLFQIIPSSEFNSVSGTWVGTPNMDILKSWYKMQDSISGGSHPFAYGAEWDTVAATEWDISMSPLGGNPWFYQHPYHIAYPINQPLHPYVLRWQIAIGLQFDGGPDGNWATTADNRMYLKLRPYVTLYNPHNVVIPNRRYIFEASFNFRLDIKVGGNPVVQARFNELLPRATHSWGSRLQLDTDLIEMQPGESLTFGLRDSSVFDKFSDQGWPITFDWQPDKHWTIEVVGPNSKVNMAAADGPTIDDGSAWLSNAQYGLTVSERGNLQPSNGVTPIELTISHDQHTVGYLLLREHWDYGQRSLLNADSAVNTHAVQPAPTTHTFNAGAGPEIITGWGMWIRPANSAASGDHLRPIIDTNFRASCISTRFDGFLTAAPNFYMPGLYQAGILDPLYWNPQSDGSARNRSYYGAGYLPADFGITHVPLFDIPQEPPTSLAHFTHARLSFFNDQPSYAVAQSYAPARMPRATKRLWNFASTSDLQVFDLSYYANEHLYDHYFLSNAVTSSGNLRTPLAQLRSGTGALPNQRLRLYDIPNLPATNSHFNTPQAFDTAAGRLLVDGPLNVNTLSVEAWKALLSSSLGVDAPRYNPENFSAAPTFISHSNEVVVSRFNHPSGTGDFGEGYRILNETQIEELAKALVEEIKLRGPSLSLASFVNRRLRNDATGLAGPLQAALDAPTANINRQGTHASSYLSSYHVDTPALASLNPSNTAIFPQNMPDSFQATGFPGWVLQSDILRNIEPLLTSRGDTFRIRAYGNLRNPIDNSLQASAWCEAIVQRVPDPVGISPSAGNFETELANPSSNLGRRFRIIGFRWLNPEDV